MSIPAIGIDLDSIEFSCPDFFAHLTSRWEGKVYGLSARTDCKEVFQKCQDSGLVFDMIYTHLFEMDAKIQKIEELGISVYFDEMSGKPISSKCSVYSRIQ